MTRFTSDPHVGSLSPLPARRKLTAVLTFDGEWWAADVQQVPGTVTHATDPHKAEPIIREAIAHKLGIDPSGFDLKVVVVPPSNTSSRRSVAS